VVVGVFCATFFGCRLGWFFVLGCVFSVVWLWLRGFFFTTMLDWLVVGVGMLK